MNLTAGFYRLGLEKGENILHLCTAKLLNLLPFAGLILKLNGHENIEPKNLHKLM